jgi:tetratricopeptide (TPR) repeat protein
MIDDFYNPENEDELEDISQLVDKVETAFEEGSLANLKFSEEEFDLVIGHFLNEADDQIVYDLSRMAFEQHPYSADLGLKYADVLIVNRETERAKEILSVLLDKVPHSGDVYFLFARAFIREDNPRLAKISLEKASELSPEDASDMYHTAAQDSIDMNDFDNALDYLSSTVAIEGETLELLNDKAFCYERLGKFDESLKEYEKCLDEDPFNDNIWFNVGTIHARELRFDKAIEAFDFALALNPTNSSVLYNKAIVFVNTEDYNKGIETFLEFLSFEPGNLFAIIGIADAFLAIDNLVDADRYFREALVLDKDNNEANTGLSYITMLRQDHFSSLIFLRRVMGKEETDYNILAHQLNVTFKRTMLPEFLLFYAISQFFLQNREQFHICLEKLAVIDQLWIRKLSEIVPKLKNDKHYSAIMRKFLINN